MRTVIDNMSNRVAAFLEVAIGNRRRDVGIAPALPVRFAYRVIHCIVERRQVTERRIVVMARPGLGIQISRNRRQRNEPLRASLHTDHDRTAARVADQFNRFRSGFLRQGIRS